MDLYALARRAMEPLGEWLEELNLNGEPYRRFLHLLALEREPEVAVELGVGDGLTTAHLVAAAAKFGGLVFGVDDRNLDLGWLNKRHPGIFKLLQCDTLGAAEALREHAGRVGLVFQDSSHHGEHSRQEWLYWRPLLAPGAAWVADDISPAFRMRDEPFGMMEYWQWIPEGEKRVLQLGRPGNGLGVVVVP